MSVLPRIERPGADEYFHYYQKYLDRVPGDDALAVLVAQIDDTSALLAGLSEPQALRRYAAGKWSVKETAVHMADAERVFHYRALSFARNDPNPLPGFDENAWAPEARADARPIADIAAELRAVRACSLALFRSLEPAMLLRRGVASGNEMSVRAAAWAIAGHERHHVALLRERYGLGG